MIENFLYYVWNGKINFENKIFLKEKEESKLVDREKGENNKSNYY